ncbi:hypothetical protein [Nocardia pseudobrasiliensis]|uniref:DUF5666 domain-containing protein n=1 Tax=Nocardia pseudobrasiliensis TaxID=45979 RepID=A0A370HZ06_9NOCA|nr:hypothetical protein [Nocardia pseudobrasiliensis]RDI63747.1 hypothetical protein DFR76_10983 [Nocardia pseudobrasiliensis]
MATPVQQPPEAEQTWGAPQPAPSNWSGRKILAAVGVAAVLAALGGGVIYAASGHSGNERGSRMSMNGPGGAMGRGGGFGGMNAALHGSFVVADGSGGYLTELTQTGTLTAVSADSITAESTDNFSRTYAITNSTTGTTDAKVGDTVSIRATESSNTATATEISEGNGVGGGRRGGGPGSRN